MTQYEEYVIGDTKEKLMMSAKYEMWQCSDSEEQMYTTYLEMNLPRKIEWHEDVILNTREEAKEWIRKHDDGKERQIAVKIRENKKPFVKSKKLEKMKERYEATCKQLEELKEYNARHWSESRKTKTIKCKECDSRINLKWLEENGSVWHKMYECPVCKADFRSATEITKETKLETKKTEYHEAWRKQEELERAKHASKGKKTIWFAKIDFWA